MTFVVLAIGRGMWAFLAYKTSPVVTSMMRAAAAEGFGSAEAEEGGVTNVPEKQQQDRKQQPDWCHRPSELGHG